MLLLVTRFNSKVHSFTLAQIMINIRFTVTPFFYNYQLKTMWIVKDFGISPIEQQLINHT